MKKLIYIIMITLFCGALVITSNKTNQSPAQETKNNYTEEDYSRYLEYKSDLIDQYGEDIYKLMNQEAGIETEEESFKHFMKYGI